jgi:hypothetical protein
MKRLTIAILVAIYLVCPSFCHARNNGGNNTPRTSPDPKESTSVGFSLDETLEAQLEHLWDAVSNSPSPRFTVTQVFSLDHPDGIPSSLLVSDAPGRLGQLIDGVTSPVCWVFPGPVAELNPLERWMIGRPNRLGAIEVSVPAHVLKDPGGLKYGFRRWQKVINEADREFVSDIKYYQLDELPLAGIAEQLNRSPQYVASVFKEIGKLKLTDFISVGLGETDLASQLAELKAVITLPVCKLDDGSLAVFVPRYKWRLTGNTGPPFVPPVPAPTTIERPAPPRAHHDYWWIAILVAALLLGGISVLAELAE